MEVQDILDLNFYRFYKEIVLPAGKNLTLPEILKFYDFCKAVKDLSSISDFYEFYAKVVAIDKNIDISQLFDDYRQAVELANEGRYNKAVKVFKSRKLKKIWKAHHPNAHQSAPAKTRQIFFDLAAITLISIVWWMFFIFLIRFLEVKMFIGTTYICTTYILWFGLTVFFGTVFFVIMKNTVWPGFYKWCSAQKLKFYSWRAVKALQPNLQECIKHYVRVIEKTPKPTEKIYEIKNNEDLSIEYSKGKLVYTPKTQNKRDEYYLMLEKKNSKDAQPMRLDLNSVHDLMKEEQLPLIYIYVNIRVYISKTNWQKIMPLICAIGAILLVLGYICYLKFFADPSHLYSFGFTSMMAGIIFCCLIYLFEKNS